LQLVLFAGYHFNIIQLEEESEIEHELQHQLRALVEDNIALQVTLSTLTLSFSPPFLSLVTPWPARQEL
jgi:hypothetical protein